MQVYWYKDAYTNQHNLQEYNLYQYNSILTRGMYWYSYYSKKNMLLFQNTYTDTYQTLGFQMP